MIHDDDVGHAACLCYGLLASIGLVDKQDDDMASWFLLDDIAFCVEEPNFPPFVQ